MISKVPHDCETPYDKAVAVIVLAQQLAGCGGERRYSAQIDLRRRIMILKWFKIGTGTRSRVLVVKYRSCMHDKRVLA